MYGLSPSSPKILSSMEVRPALWGLLRVLERVSELGKWTAVKAEFFIDGSILGGMYFDFRENIPGLGLDTNSSVANNNMAVGGNTSPLVLPSDLSTSTVTSTNSSNSSKQLAVNSSTAFNATLWPSIANLTSSSSISPLADTYGRTKLIPHFGSFPLNSY